jgi:outer membrane protein assembly factor BamB
MDVVSVVPIFMSAGAAVLPTLIAGITSVAAVIFNPRALVRVYRERPALVGGVCGIVILLSFAIWWLVSATGSPPAKAAATGVVRYDWAKVAEQIIDQEKIRARMKPATNASVNERPVAAIVAGRDFSRCGYAGGTSPRELLKKWAFPLDNVDDIMFFSTPVVTPRRIFVAGATPQPTFPTGMLACLDAETGKPLWKVDRIGGKLTPAYYSSPALTADGKYLVIGSGLHEDKDCFLRCFDAATGDLHWAVQTSLHIESSPAIFGDIAVAGCGAIEGKDGKAIGNPGHVLAVRISDGKELWRQPVNDPESSPAIDDEGMVFIGSGFNGNAIVALHSAPGEELKKNNLDRIAWRTPVAFPITSAITIAGDLIIAGGGNSDFVFANPDPHGLVVALERKTGKIRWQQKFADSVLSEIAFRDGKLICPVRTGEVFALDVADGHVLWHTPISGTAPVLAGCAFTGKLIYAVSNDGYLAILDPLDGKILEKKTPLNDASKAGEGRCYCAPQVVNGVLIVGSETGGVRCYVGARSIE